MSKMYLCTINDSESSENNLFILNNIKDALKGEDVEFIKPEKVKELNPKEDSILYFTINADGIDKYKEVIDPHIHLISWINGDFSNVIKDLQLHSIHERLILLSSSRIWLDLLKRIFPNSIVKFLHSGYNPELFNKKSVKKQYDISMFIGGRSPEQCEDDIKAIFDEKTYEILKEMMLMGVRNSNTNIYNIISQFEICYGIKFSNDKRFSDSLSLIEEYMYIQKQLNVLKALSGYGMNVWGDEFVKDYLSSKQTYEGTFENSMIPELAEKSKVVVNVDSFSPLLGYQENTLNLIATSAKVLTDYNLVLKESFDAGNYKYYYHCSNHKSLISVLEQAIEDSKSGEENNYDQILESLTWQKKLEFLVKG